MTHLAFARKYRPQVFDDISGQPHITTTLKNAISQNRSAHAYLFAGPRGVGKTTTARIFAKAVNCEKPKGPNPCNSCDSCKEITQGSSLDILEIDGASNRGIDEIRNLRDNVKFSPSKGRFKVYIIDEVHMLTPEAFNALLKTLEEPPPHIKFIFATTQPHKVPQTILSRCQRFDFRRIATADILKNLKSIAEKEKLKIRDEALALIAKYSDSSMRDAQVLLDQIASFTQGAVETEDAAKMLGVIDDDILFGLSNAIAEKKPLEGLKIIDRLINDGKDVNQVVAGLLEHFRNISVIKLGNDASSLIDASEEKIKLYKEESARFTVEDILYVIYTMSNTIDFMRKTNLARIPFEAAILKLTQKGSIASLADIMERVKALEENRPKGAAHNPQPAVNGEKPAVNSPQPAAHGSQSTNSADLEEVLSAWSAVINQVKQKKISIGSYLAEGYPVSLEAGILNIGFPSEFSLHKEVLESADNRRLIEEAIEKTLRVELRVEFSLVEPVKIKRRDADKDKEEDAGFDQNDNSAAEKGHGEPIVDVALEMFGGQIAEKRPDPRRPS